MGSLKEVKLLINVDEEDKELNFIKNLDDEIIINTNEAAKELKFLSSLLNSYDYVIELSKYYCTLGQWDKALKAMEGLSNEDIFKSVSLKEDVLLKANILLNNKKYYNLEYFLNDKRLKDYDFPELFYFKGIVAEAMNFNYLAIKNYKKFLENSNRINKEYVELLCQVYLSLGDILFKEKVYEEAKEYYERFLTSNKGTLDILTKYGYSVFKAVKDSEKANEILRASLMNKGVNGIYILGEVLFNIGRYDYALETFIEGSKLEYSDRMLIRIGEILMYAHDYQRAKEIFKVIPTSSLYAFEGIMNSILVDIIETRPNIEEKLLWIEESNLRRALEILVLEDEEIKDKLGKDNPDELLKWYMKILDNILKASEFKLFEKGLKGLNHIDSPFVLTELASIYKNNHFEELATEEIEKSIERFKFVSKRDMNILYHNP